MELVAGIDEVGRGCLAGPVYAAAVILPTAHSIEGLRDSKLLSRMQRESLAPRIHAVALDFAIGIASVEEIDALNILQATFLAMRRAVAALRLRPTLCRVDGNRPPPLDCAVQTEIGGDRTVDAIMAAAIVAKVARDAEMHRLDALHPGYGLAQHKGYCTREHLEALQTLGVCSIHRMSFAPCAKSGVRFPVVGFQRNEAESRALVSLETGN